MNKKFAIRKKDGLPYCYEPIESIDDATLLANNMAKSGYYPAGMDPCFVAGMNGDWGDDGVCPIYKIDKNECTCEYLLELNQ